MPYPRSKAPDVLDLRRNSIVVTFDMVDVVKTAIGQRMRSSQGHIPNILETLVIALTIDSA